MDGTGGYGLPSYLDSDGAVEIHLDGSPNHGGDAEGDTYRNINGVIGSHHADTLIGNQYDKLHERRCG